VSLAKATKKLEPLETVSKISLKSWHGLPQYSHQLARSASMPGGAFSLVRVFTNKMKSRGDRRQPQRCSADRGISIISWACCAVAGALFAQLRRVSAFSMASLSSELVPLRRLFVFS
jgi:hypothetical protein